MNYQQKVKIIAYWLDEFRGTISYLSFQQKELVEFVNPKMVTPLHPRDPHLDWTDADMRSLLHEGFDHLFEDMQLDPHLARWVEQIELSGDRVDDVCRLLIEIGETIYQLSFLQKELLHYLQHDKLFNCSFQEFTDCLKHGGLSGWYGSIGKAEENDIGMLYLALQED